LCRGVLDGCCIKAQERKPLEERKPKDCAEVCWMDAILYPRPCPRHVPRGLQRLVSHAEVRYCDVLVATYYYSAAHLVSHCLLNIGLPQKRVRLRSQQTSFN